MNIFQRAWVETVKGLGKIHWSAKDTLSATEMDGIRKCLRKDYYIMLSRRNNHVSTYLVSLGHFFLTGKFSYWSHAFMNVENDVTADSDFRIVEAIGTGVEYTPFAHAFDVNGVVLLKPKNMTIDKWTAVLDRARSELGKPYDNLFDLKSDQALSCVELIRTALMAEPDYFENFAHFEARIAKEKNLTPQMIYECEDFEVVLEIRH